MSYHEPSVQNPPTSDKKSIDQKSNVSGSQKESGQGKRSKADHSEEPSDIIPPYTPLVPEQWQEKCIEMGHCKIIKFRKIFQTLFYLCQYQTRESICQKDTNRLEWKKCRQHFKVDHDNVMEDNIYKKMKEYNPFGAKDGEFKEYQRLTFLKHNIDEIDEEKVEEYSVTLVRIYKWIKLAIELRIEDILFRREKKTRERKSREDTILKEQKRNEKREQVIEKNLASALKLHEKELKEK